MDEQYYLAKEGQAETREELLTVEYWRNDKSFRFLETKKKYLKSPVGDFGCGYGPLTILTARMGFTVTGFDINEQYLENGSKLRQESDRVTFARCLLSNIPAPDHSFASGICKEVLEHITAPDIPAVLNEFKRVLKPGANLIFTVPRESLLKPVDPFHHVTFFHSPRELARYLKKNGFTIVKKEFNRIYRRICVIARTPH
jgi:2-polyprenyl-3-methyl-5-hydroxy-6-metoxy-1,4-benzoquinol methylase